MPPATLEAFRDHGETRESLRSGLDAARQIIAQLEDLGIDLPKITRDLQTAGVESFAKAFDSLLADLDEKRKGA